MMGKIMARLKILLFITAFVFSSMVCYAHEKQDDNLDFNIEKIQKLTQQTGQLDQAEKTYSIVIPRDDLKILMSGMELPVNRGLSSRIYFKKTDNQTVVSGDLILLQDQVNPVMSVALKNGLEVTGLNNPYLWDSPRVMVMRIKGEGDVLQLASSVGEILRTIKTTSNGGGDFPIGDFYSSATTLTGHKIDVLLGVKGEFKDNVYQVQFNNELKKTDTDINKIIAVNTWASFAGSDNEAVVNGSIVIHPSELQKALVTLRNAQIYILAIYQYPVDDDQTLMSINFWGVGSIQVLAKTLRSTFLVAQNDNFSKIQREGILAENSAVNIEKIAGITPISSSLLQNSYCSYASALRNSSKFVETTSNQPVLSQNQETAAKTIPTLSEPKDLVYRIFLPSAKVILSRLSVVKNNRLDSGLLSHLLSPIAVTAVTNPLSPKPHNAMVSAGPVVSARLILSRLSVVKNNKLQWFLLSRPLNKNSATVTVVTNPVPVLPKPQNPVVPIGSVVSARLILSKLSVVKNNSRVQWVLLPGPLNKNPATATVVTNPVPVLSKPQNPVVLVGSVVSARLILSKLSVVKNNSRVRWVLLSHPLNKNPATVTTVSPIVSKPQDVRTRPSPVISAREMLLKLSVVKNNKLVIVLLSNRPIIGWLL